ncbi:Protein of unknown function [Filimonas lacunae]|uniref:DUF3175 domain-containing protein n=1 Tax=Filimonas lacunae TaxID=477680 RepID=A0A173MQI5_9BACT|nr:DUF3175 domain-containing protein [Filimonas lacunae]BAV09709.1 hypothetical protein FLA_5762 [Filimonas lacunae]SIS77626.1 Protein of unknown function [Filimonas lacunae]
MTQHKKKTTRRKKWSAQVMATSDAMDLKDGIFKKEDPHAIAVSLKNSSRRSHRRKGTPYQSAMSMLNFYINRGGKNLPEKQKAVLEKAKAELKKVFHKE